MSLIGVRVFVRRKAKPNESHTRDHGRASLDCGCLSLPKILRGLLNGVYVNESGEQPKHTVTSSPVIREPEIGVKARSLINKLSVS